MARVQAGDRQAFQLLMNRHVAGLHRFAQRLLGNSAEAEDVTQETLLRLWQHAGVAAKKSVDIIGSHGAPGPLAPVSESELRTLVALGARSDRELARLGARTAR